MCKCPARHPAGGGCSWPTSIPCRYAGSRPARRGRWIVPCDKQTGLGGDDRAGNAAILSAALEILRRKLPHPPLSFLWTVQEEIGLFGARYSSLGMLGRPALAFNFDGSSTEKVTTGATGGYRLKIHVAGRASHAGVNPEQGVGAITIASLAIAQLHGQGWLGRIVKGDCSGTSNVGVIHGGEATNVVTPAVDLRAEARSHDPAFRRQIVLAIKRAFRDAARKVRSSLGGCGKVSFDGRLDYEAFRLPDDDPSVLEAEAAVRQLGGEPVRIISSGGLDANWLFARGIRPSPWVVGRPAPIPLRSGWTGENSTRPAASPCGWLRGRRVSPPPVVERETVR